MFTLSKFVALSVSLSISAFVFSTAALGQSVPPVDEVSQVRLIAVEGAVGGADTLHLGLHMRLAKGWKTYWRDPGDAGAPPEFDWSQSHNLLDITPLWPAPKRFTAFGYDSFGYESEIVFPFRVKVADPSQPVSARLNVQYLLCKDVCIPNSAQVELNLAAASAPVSVDASLIDAYIAKVPQSGENSSIRVSHVLLTGKAGQQQLVLQITSSLGFRTPDVMVEAGTDVRFSRPTFDISEDGKSAVARLSIHTEEDAPTDLTGRSLVVTLVDSDQASEFRTQLRRAP